LKRMEKPARKMYYKTLQYQVLLHHWSNPMQWHSNWVCPTEEIVADYMTKPLIGAKLEGLHKDYHEFP
jgi:hypothetical protein